MAAFGASSPARARHRADLARHRRSGELALLPLSSGMEDARQLLVDYQNLLTQVEYLRGLIQAGFRKALDRAIPPLNEMLTRSIND
jgi:hypothetical protein